MQNSVMVTHGSVGLAANVAIDTMRLYNSDRQFANETTVPTSQVCIVPIYVRQMGTIAKQMCSFLSDMYLYKNMSNYTGMY